jgi:hypothetical protein
MMNFHERVEAAKAFGRLTPEERRALVQKGLIERITTMAKSVKGHRTWPAWSTGEVLIVAIVLNDHEMLTQEGYTIAQAYDRVDLDVATLRAIEREVMSS